MGLFDKIKSGAKKVARSVKNFFFDEDEDFEEEICEEELDSNEEKGEDFEDSKRYYSAPKEEQLEDNGQKNVFCAKCGAKNIETAKFCFNCGDSIKKEQKKFCVNCGKKIEDDSIFCIHCGTKVGI
ncbi:MAG: zinc ribbon domain-containing protein [Clostridia bacterium]|nr:zinc ribbon domain-containing protein [Clostridia bacterium]